jgi:hypothetical protein
LRTTALPTRELTVTPSRLVPLAAGAWMTTKLRLCRRCPCLCNCRNSLRLRNRTEFGKAREPGTGINPAVSAEWRPSAACGPWLDDASTRPGPWAWPCGLETRGYAFAAGCSAGRSSSSRTVAQTTQPTESQFPGHQSSSGRCRRPSRSATALAGGLPS